MIIAVATLFLTAGLALGQPAQQSTERPLIGMGSKTMESCRADTQKYCASSSEYMRRECLVKNWNNIASDCQDALGTHFDGVSGRRGD